ncbi:hypothetical protein BC830DRAFT_483764 [Chytriomyces sp. MP71]|nr:hypothetical protein BC830DRAFT_483764 [Chytriomyces sp. MP71]
MPSDVSVRCCILLSIRPFRFPFFFMPPIIMLIALHFERPEMSLQNSSEMSTAPDSSTSLIQRIDDSEYPGYLNYLEEDDDEEMMGSDDEMYEDDYDDEDAESDAELEDAIAQSPTQPTTSVQPSPDVKNQKDKDEQVEQNQVDMRKQILLIQQNIKMTPQEKAKKIQVCVIV